MLFFSPLSLSLSLSHIQMEQPVTDNMQHTGLNTSHRDQNIDADIARDKNTKTPSCINKQIQPGLQFKDNLQMCKILAKHQGKHADTILYLGITMTQAGLNSRHCATQTKLTCGTASWQAKGSVSLCISWAIPVSGSEKTRSRRVWNKDDGRCDLMGTQSLCTEIAGMARVCQDAFIGHLDYGSCAQQSELHHQVLPQSCGMQTDS